MHKATNRKQRKSSLARLLFRCRAEHGLTQTDVAHAVRVSAATISRFERGVHTPIPTVRYLLRAYLIQQGYLRGRAA